MDLNDIPESFTNITNTLAEKPSIATLATVFLSFTGVQDWIKLFLIGGVLETCRRTILQGWQNILDLVWITVDLEDGDDSYGGSFHLSPSNWRRRAITQAVMSARAQALTKRHYRRLDDGVAFATSLVGKGEEARHQHLVVWDGIHCGYIRQPQVRESKGPLRRGVRLRLHSLAQETLHQGDKVKGRGLFLSHHAISAS